MKYIFIILLSIGFCFSQTSCQSTLNEPLIIKLDTAIWFINVSNIHDKDPRVMRSGSVNVFVKGSTNAKKLYFRQLGMGLLSYEKIKLDSIGNFIDTLFYSSTLNLTRDSFQCHGTLFATNDTTQTESNLHFSPFLENDIKNTIHYDFISPYLSFNF